MKLFQNKTNYPGFWKRYQNCFENDLPQEIDQIRFVVLDTETTGFDLENDRILTIGALVVKDSTIRVDETLELYLKQKQYHSRAVDIHGIISNERKPCCTEHEALERLLGFIGNAVIVAHHANFDISMINKALRRHKLPKLQNIVLDTGVLYKKTLIKSPLLERREKYTLDHLAHKFNISKEDRHTALGDAYITAIAFMIILTKLRLENNFSLKDLLIN